jgi:hypothetical protein
MQMQMHMQMKTMTRLSVALAALALSLGAAAQPAPVAGPYLIAAVGRTDYTYDCWFFVSCNTARSTAGKFGGGYRYGVFGIEGWWMDFGRAATNWPGDTLHVSAAGVSAVWTARFGASLEGSLRAGVADVHHERSNDKGTRAFEPTFGAALGVVLNPQLSIEGALDITRGDGDQTGTTLAKAVTIGLRLRF